jgi:hypothetical protein
VIHTNVLQFRKGKYFWWSGVLVVGAFVLYASERPPRPRSGHSWQGYVLGTLGATLIIWLSLLAVRKRRYSSTVGTLQGWTSAHIYLGTALLVVATLHSALQVGWNVHTLAYALMCLVIGSGLFGVYNYLHYPKILAENREGGGRARLFAELFDLDKQTRGIADSCASTVHTAVASSIERTVVGGGAWAQLSSRDDSLFLRPRAIADTPALAGNTDQQAVIDFVAERIPRADKTEETARLQQLLLLLCRRQVILRRLRRDIRLQGWLKLWLYVHVRLTLALFVALGTHIVSTFIYR